MKIFTVTPLEITDGVEIGTFELKNGTVIDALVLGGFYRYQVGTRMLPVKKTTAEKTLLFAELGTTRSGKNKLIETTSIGSKNEVLIYMKSVGGFRGGGVIEGDWKEYGSPENTQDFPGKILANGRDENLGGDDISYFAKMKIGDIFMFNMWGRLYGRRPKQVFFKVSSDSEGLPCIEGPITPEERDYANLW